MKDLIVTIQRLSDWSCNHRAEQLRFNLYPWTQVKKKRQYDIVSYCRLK